MRHIKKEVIMEYSEVCSKFCGRLKDRAAILAWRVGVVCKESVLLSNSVLKNEQELIS